ncbi:phage shock protein C (PspC) family protein [Salana multivorans]|uniref:Phage shock protein C (PspC) family protein n=1 Tax=Salana multivorans TaxID=120377 RepID=A0A3N2D2V9_9MICO|nr:PspC domain-containing protein [Salana multivorans]MBN8883215.1 PspC domain-containing protein [Salana multivorans]OJX95591.1 MAG: hypothetical protein BGO96_08085 [Micrococcales bacterium 73-15]ROR93824.1 phage shock protein C (PspC) family protein [Salana multivorans]
MDSIFNAIRSTGFRRGPKPVLGGVCAGIARTLGIEANLVRLIVVALMIFAGLPLAVYLVVWILTPAQDGSIPAQTFLASVGVGTTGTAAAPQYPTTPAQPTPAQPAAPAPMPTPPSSLDLPEGVQNVPYAQDR